MTVYSAMIQRRYLVFVSLLKSMSSSHCKRELLASGFIRRLPLIPLIPTAIIKLFSLWINLLDKWDVTNTHDGLQVVEKYLRIDGDGITKQQYECVKRTANHDYKWYHSFGTDIVNNGEKKTWKLQLNTINSPYKYLVSLIGIIDHKDIDKNIIDFTNNDVFGYGLATANKSLYHQNDSHDFKYLMAYTVGRDKNILTMELDLTKETNGTLSYYIDGVDNQYSNVAFKDIDVNRGYRLTVALYYQDEIVIIDTL